MAKDFIFCHVESSGLFAGVGSEDAATVVAGGASGTGAAVVAVGADSIGRSFQLNPPAELDPEVGAGTGAGVDAACVGTGAGAADTGCNEDAKGRDFQSKEVPASVSGEEAEVEGAGAGVALADAGALLSVSANGKDV